MRTLSRPMFNMGGPIKQGIMHGIREPYRGGGKAALVGNPVFPKDRTGRAHHAIQVPIGMGIMAGARAIGPWAARMGSRYLPKIKRMFGTTSPGKTTQAYTGYSEYGPATYKTVTGPGKFNPNWLGRDPIVRSADWARKALINPTTAGFGKKALRFATSPSSFIIGGVTWYNWPDGTQRKTPPPGDMKQPGRGDEGMYYKAPPKKLSEAERLAFAKSQREERVNKYLDMMGYDRSKKMAIADALIDASKIVSDRGTLDPKNITQELINPVIQATSKRLDKPQQIREAVGLMMTKAGLEKEMYEAKPGTVLKNVQDMVKSGNFTEEEAWAIATKGSQGVIADLQGAISTGKVSMADWPSFVRATGAQHGEDVTVITAEEIKKDPEKYARFKDKSIMEIVEGSPDGIYVIGSETVRIKGGKKTQIR